MIRQIDFGMTDGREYYLFYDDTKMTEEQALKECEFVGWGAGYNESLYPYYLIVPKGKKSILSAIKEEISDEYYDIGYNHARAEYGGYD
jgi:hypothetical protein